MVLTVESKRYGLSAQVADAMLRMESAEVNVTFFAAQTIHAKIRSNFRELPQERWGVFVERRGSVLAR